MGGRSYFVWGAVSGADIGAGEPRLRLEADGRMLVELAPLPRDFALPVSQPPYPKPVAWATERWYAIDRDGLLRLRGQGAVRPSLVAAGGEVWQFEPWEAPPDALDRYVTEQVGDAALSR
jgi:hypothetical protein